MVEGGKEGRQNAAGVISVATSLPPIVTYPGDPAIPPPKVVVLVGMNGWPSDQRVGDPLLEAQGLSVTLDVRTHCAQQRGVGPGRRGSGAVSAW